MKLMLDGKEISKAIEEYLKRQGHKPTGVGLYAEAGSEPNSKPTFWAIAEVKNKEKKA